jgi:hypothetical protein
VSDDLAAAVAALANRLPLPSQWESPEEPAAVH